MFLVCFSLMQTIDHTVSSGPAPAASLRERMRNWLGVTSETTVKVYHGYGHTNRLTIYGHVLRTAPLPRIRYSKSVINNTVALLRLFFVEPFPGIEVRLKWQGKEYRATTDTDGFFKIEWKDDTLSRFGWYTVRVDALLNADVIASSHGKVYIPHETQYGFISDIDDTFLISHSANMRKRLYVLFTQNARSRQPFEGVVRHYQLLAQSRTTADAPNPFFFVSSSEWNLYDYILEFTRVNRIPEGVFLLNQLKQFDQLLKTGQNNHQTKFTRIVRILENYPNQRFVLLGDSSQHDPYIYQSIVEHFPKQIHAVYIRDVHHKNRTAVADVLKSIESAGVPCCFFDHSEDAILHSKKIDLISEHQLVEAMKEKKLV
ncbi:MAG TPA: phosphatase domain-containing protein [Flavisolibacter sp.]